MEIAVVHVAACDRVFGDLELSINKWRFASGRSSFFCAEHIQQLGGNSSLSDVISWGCQRVIYRVMAKQIIGQLVEETRSDRESSPDEKLSPKEVEVLRSLTRGRTNKEIASTLKITESTVENHLRSILAKLHLANRVQAAAFALEKGIVPENDPSQ